MYWQGICNSKGQLLRHYKMKHELKTARYGVSQRARGIACQIDGLPGARVNCRQRWEVVIIQERIAKGA